MELETTAGSAAALTVSLREDYMCHQIFSTIADALISLIIAAGGRKKPERKSYNAIKVINNWQSGV